MHLRTRVQFCEINPILKKFILRLEDRQIMGHDPRSNEQYLVKEYIMEFYDVLDIEYY